MIKLARFSEQKKNQRAIKNKNRNLEHNHGDQLADTFELISKKLKKVNESTEKLEENYEITDSENKTPEVVIATLPSIDDQSPESFVLDASLHNTLEGNKASKKLF